MKSRNLLFSLAAIALMGFAIVLTTGRIQEKKMYHPRKVVIENGIYGALEWLAEIRNNPSTGTVSIEEVLNAKKQITELTNHKSLGITWSDLGPNNVGGRTRAILVDKNNSNLIYAGAVSGGLWKSTTGGTSWQPVSSFPDTKICCIAQSPVTGYLYVGTGESFANVDYAFGTPGYIGSGIYESTDGGNTWAIFHGATPTVSNSTSDVWAFVNKIAIDPVNGRLYAATDKGLKYWDDATSTWINPIYITGTTHNTGVCNTVRVGSDRTVAVVIANRIQISPGGSGNGDDHTFTDKSPATSLGRTEIAIAPSNPNYIYACAAAGTGALKNVYRSTDRGDNWIIIGPGGAPGFNLFGDNVQGSYDNSIAVFPNNPDHIIVGGICIWEWFNGGNFTQITIGDADYDVHSDVHEFTFDPTNPNIYYVGSDGGIDKTSDAGLHFQTINKNYNVTQFYALANSKTGEVMGGTQDNSNPYISRTEIDPQNATILYGGDGGWAAFSAINPDIFFGTIYYGGAWRSPDRGATYQSASANQFFSPTMIGTAVPGTTTSFGLFVTPLLHWESFGDLESTDSVTFYADTNNYAAGATVMAQSSNCRYEFQYTLPYALSEGDSIKVQDIISSKFFVALGSGVWMTKKALNFAITPKWFKICDKANIQTMTISNDGNYLFVGTSSGSLYRISNLLQVRDSLTGYITSPFCVLEQKLIESWSGRSITSIAVDPNDPSRVIATLGNYGQANYIYFSSNALDADPTFTTKQGTTAGKKLPAMPCYASLIEMSDGNRVLIGTEYGIFATADITKSAALIEWTEENDGMSPVPVYGIHQQTQVFPGMGNNYGTIYIATHGRGFFETNKYLSVPDSDPMPILAQPSLNIYPNPVVNFANINYTLPVSSKVIVNVYDLNGRMVRTIDLSNQGVGIHQASIDCNTLERGAYFLQLIAGKESTTAKFVLTK
jgi:hypothetical protein